MSKGRRQKTEEESYIHTHKSNDPYVHVDKHLVNDRRLNWDTMGLLVYLVGKPDNWKTRTSQLKNYRSAGRDAIRRMLKEAESFGYVRRVRENKEGGRFAWVTHVYEHPKLNPNFTPPSTGLPSTAEPSTAEPSTANPSTYQYPSLPINEFTNSLSLPNAAAAFFPSLVKEDLDDSNSQCRDHAHDATRIAAARFAAETFPNGGFNGLAGYINDLPPDRLTLFCALCYYANIKADRGDDDIDDFAAFIRGMTQKGHPPSFTPQEQEQFDIRMTAYLHEIESDVWEESQESEVTI